MLWQCKSCGHQTSVTVLHRTRTPLTHWFWAAYLVATHSPGLSALQLQRQLGIPRYATAWALLHKLRRAMVRPDRELLKEIVEVDETFIGGLERGRPGRQLVDKALVVAAVEVRGRASGRVRLRVVPDSSGASLTRFIKSNVASGAVVLTDGWHGYASLSDLGYRHGPKTQGPHPKGRFILPRVHRVFGQLKTWLHGIHHGVSNQHLQAYLDEFTFRFYAEPRVMRSSSVRS